jgi:hypothetical protein
VCGTLAGACLLLGDCGRWCGGRLAGGRDEVEVEDGGLRDVDVGDAAKLCRTEGAREGKVRRSVDAHQNNHTIPEGAYSRDAMPEDEHQLPRMFFEV